MTTTAPPVVEPRFVLVRFDPDPERHVVPAAPADPGRADPGDMPAPRAAPERAPHRAVPPHPSRGRRPALPLVPGSVRAGAREAAARRRAEIVVRTALEVFDGRRPVAHLTPYAVPEVLRYVAAGVPGRSHGGGSALRSLHCAPVGRSAAEVTAVCRVGCRVRALAARLDLTPTGDWRCTALRVL